MITSTITFAMHLYFSSYQGIRAVTRVLGYTYTLPYSNMAAVKGNINFNTKHLKKGDPLPPASNKLRVYNMRFCPFAQRTILALNAKELDYEVVNIDLMDKPEWLASKSPLMKVPAIETVDGASIFESLVTVEYLDDVYPQRPLLPKDPVLKAYDKIIVEISSAIHTIYFRIVRLPETLTDEMFVAYYKALDYIQEQLQKRGTKFLDGDQPGYGDYMIWPWFERIRAMDDDRINITGEKYKLLLSYLDNMAKDPAVSQYLVPKEVFKKFHSAYSQGQKPDYDVLFQD